MHLGAGTVFLFMFLGYLAWRCIILPDLERLHHPERIQTPTPPPPPPPLSWSEQYERQRQAEERARQAAARRRRLPSGLTWEEYERRCEAADRRRIPDLVWVLLALPLFVALGGGVIHLVLGFSTWISP